MAGLLFALLVPDPPGSRRSATRNATADAVAVTVALAYGALMVPLGDATRPGAFLPWQADVALGLLCWAALLMRGRRPVWVAVALLPVSAVSVMATGAALVALFTVAIHRRGAVAAALGLAYVAAGPVYFVLHDNPEFPIW